jgi:hypothetical protein
VRTDVWSNKHKKGYNSRKNQPSVKSVIFEHAQIMANQDTKYVFCRILFIFGILVGHDLSMLKYYRFHGWLIFARVIALFMFVWPYVCLHILCIGRTYGQTNMKRAITLAKINHPWNRYNKRMLRSWPTKIPNMNKMRLIPPLAEWWVNWNTLVRLSLNLVYVTSHLLDFIHIWYLGWPWSEQMHT